jgi:hypothetical protein
MKTKKKVGLKDLGEKNSMERRIFGIAFQLKDGKFQKMPPQVVGKIDENGHIGGTDYTFSRGIKGGIAITTNSTLEVLEDGSLRNPATGDVFEETKSKKGFVSKASKVFIKPYGGKKK